MKAKIIGIVLLTLLISSAVAFTRSNIDMQKSDLLVQENMPQVDSVYYGCVPCCQPCSVYTTNKPGECPHCGMVLEKRLYQAGVTNSTQNTTINNKACKTSKDKKKHHVK